MISSDSAAGIAWAVYGAQVTLQERHFCRSVGPAQSCTVKDVGCLCTLGNKSCGVALLHRFPIAVHRAVVLVD